MGSWYPYIIHKIESCWCIFLTMHNYFRCMQWRKQASILDIAVIARACLFVSACPPCQRCLLNSLGVHACMGMHWNPTLHDNKQEPLFLLFVYNILVLKSYPAWSTSKSHSCWFLFIDTLLNLYYNSCRCDGTSEELLLGSTAWHDEFWVRSQNSSCTHAHRCI